MPHGKNQASPCSRKAEVLTTVEEGIISMANGMAKRLERCAQLYADMRCSRETWPLCLRFAQPVWRRGPWASAFG